MREIKFRVWDKKKEVIRFANVLNMRFDLVECSPIENVDSEIQMSDVVLKKSEFELMEYTGFRDTSNFEIYTGYVGFDSHSEVYGVVKLENGKYIYDCDSAIYDLSDIYKSVDFIGNIYENPELLERGEEE